MNSELNTLPLSAAACETPRNGVALPQGRAVMLADALAWAVRHQVPLQEAISTLPYYHAAPIGRIFFGSWPRVTTPFLPMKGGVWVGDLAWSNSLEALKADLDGGEHLSIALANRLGRALPGFYALGVAKAEKEGRLETALPLLAQRMNHPGTAAHELKSLTFIIAVRLIAIWYFVTFLSVFIVPRFEEIFDDLGAVRGGSASWGFIQGTSLVLAQIALLLLGAGFILYLLYRFTDVADYVLMLIPGVRAGRRRFLLTDLANSMGSFLAEGDDLLGAAQWSREATRSAWMKQRIDRFIEGLQRGEPWVDAWDRMGMGDTLHAFIIRNAGAREDPATGFEQLAEWLHYENIRALRRFQIWLDPVVTLVLAVVVGTVCAYFFHGLAAMMYSLM